MKLTKVSLSLLFVVFTVKAFLKRTSASENHLIEFR
jgi:hypothetical protein